MLWYKRIKESKESLENHMESINEMISKFNLDANQFKNQFANKEITSNFPLNLPFRAFGVPERLRAVRTHQGQTRDARAVPRPQAPPSQQRLRPPSRGKQAPPSAFCHRQRQRPLPQRRGTQARAGRQVPRAGRHGHPAQGKPPPRRPAGQTSRASAAKDTAPLPIL